VTGPVTSYGHKTNRSDYSPAKNILAQGLGFVENETESSSPELILMKLNSKLCSNLKNKPVNHAAATAYIPNAYNKLYLECATSLFGEKKFYEDNSKQIVKDIKEMLDIDPTFVMQLAIFCKEELNLRTIPLVMLAEACNAESTIGHSQKILLAANRIVTRADALTELLSYQLNTYGKPIPKAMRKILRGGLNACDEYELAKYAGKKQKVSMRDVLFLARPKPKDVNQQKLFNKLAKNELKNTRTWESVVSKDGNNKESWEKILPSMNYMALLRNLRNLIEQKVDNKLYIKRLDDKKEVLKSKQFPFRFYSAHKVVSSLNTSKNSIVLDALENAINYSLENVPKISGKTLLVADHSGSMESKPSERSQLSMKTIADVCLSMGQTVFTEKLTGCFGDTFEYVHTNKKSILSNMKLLEDIDVGYSTNGYTIIEKLITDSESVDRVIIFTDCQLWDSAYDTSLEKKWKQYTKSINIDAKLYIIDMSGYGTLQFPEGAKNVINIAGWNESIFKFINMYENSNKICLDIIKNIEF